jgi:hypothetical protein
MLSCLRLTAKQTAKHFGVCVLGFALVRFMVLGRKGSLLQTDGRQEETQDHYSV